MATVWPRDRHERYSSPDLRRKVCLYVFIRIVSSTPSSHQYWSKTFSSNCLIRFASATFPPAVYHHVVGNIFHLYQLKTARNTCAILTNPTSNIHLNLSTSIMLGEPWETPSCSPEQD